MPCVPHAAPCGHFASLVRSIAAQSARLPSASLRRISRQSLDCLRVRPLRLSPSAPRPLSAAPCGHFASLVRSIAAQSARLPSESFAFFGTSAGAFFATVARLRASLRRGVSLRAAPCGHFASLVRSIAAQSARLPSASLRRIPAQPPFIPRTASIRRIRRDALVAGYSHQAPRIRPVGVCRARAADCALAPLATPPPLAR